MHVKEETSLRLINFVQAGNPMVNPKDLSTVLTTVAVNVAMSFVLIGLTSASSGCAQTAASANQSKTADQAFKNIQVLNAIEADDLVPAMQFITGSLGVQCNYCHVEG